MAGAEEIIFHNFATSPFSEKIRLVFGMKGLSWSSVEVPVMLPKPDLMPLTGGYRKTPVMQIGADIYCDTQLIIRELDRRFPSADLCGKSAGLTYALGFWSDRPFFMASVPVIFAKVGDTLPAEFRRDREAMSGGTFSVEAMKAAAPFMRDQWRAHAGFVAEQLADGRDFLLGGHPSVADAHAYMNFWFVRNAVPQIVQAVFAEWPKLEFWYSRLAAMGHGERRDIDAKAALEVAFHAAPTAKPAEDPHEPRIRPGMRVSIAADDYGRDPVEGDVIFTTANEIAIRRNHPAVGEVAVHFPRAGFVVTPR